jgi:hypothetical protein
LQVLFYGWYLAGVSRTKSPVFVDIDDPGVLKADNHIRSMVAIYIGEAERDRDQVVAVTIELWAYIHARFRGVATRKLDHFNTSVQIQRDKVARIGCRVVLPNHDIGLKCARTTICVLPLFLGTAQQNDANNTEKKYGREH